MKTMTKLSPVQERLKVLLRDFGFRLSGNTLIQNGVRGFTSDRIMGHGFDYFTAAEHLCPIIAEAEYSHRLQQITHNSN